MYALPVMFGHPHQMGGMDHQGNDTLPGNIGMSPMGLPITAPVFL